MYFAQTWIFRPCETVLNACIGWLTCPPVPLPYSTVASEYGGPHKPPTLGIVPSALLPHETAHPIWARPGSDMAFIIARLDLLRSRDEATPAEGTNADGWVKGENGWLTPLTPMKSYEILTCLVCGICTGGLWHPW